MKRQLFSTNINQGVIVEVVTAAHSETNDLSVKVGGDTAVYLLKQESPDS